MKPLQARWTDSYECLGHALHDDVRRAHSAHRWTSGVSGRAQISSPKIPQSTLACSHSLSLTAHDGELPGRHANGGSRETLLCLPHLNAMRPNALLALLVLGGLFAARPAPAADNLRLAPGLSFTDDSSSNFPIEGDHLGNGDLTQGLAFFGASHCWNTNREAERVVALYPRFRDHMSFLIVDVNHPSDANRALLAAYYHGSIPTLVVFAPSGAVLYERAGETARVRGDSRALEAILTKAVND